MMFVPVVPTTPSAPPPSPRTRELSGLLTKLVEEYSAAHPSVSKEEIRQAIRMTQLSVRGGNRATSLVVTLSLGVLVAVLALGLFFLRGNGAVAWESVMPGVVLGILVLLIGVLVLVKTLSR